MDGFYLCESRCNAEMSEWHTLVSPRRLGDGGAPGDTSRIDPVEFQNDYDTLIFSAPFRRLQNKTQVFPLPGSIFVHNRLTHSLEVAAVGSRIARNAMLRLSAADAGLGGLVESCVSITAAACLAHDLGNPPFGHAGERAIATFFAEGGGQEIEPLVREDLGEKKGRAYWSDLCKFDGNANAFRLLTRQYEAGRWGGSGMTLSVLAAVVKYPYSSTLCEERHKFGFFVSESETFKHVAATLGMVKLRDDEEGLCYARHPLAYFVEAADDICYQIMDMEDAAKLHIVTANEAESLLLSFLDGRVQGDNCRRSEDERIASLRTAVIDRLIDESVGVFCENCTDILNGTFKGSLIEHASDKVSQAYRACTQVARERIYTAHEVVDVELAGYHIIHMLLDLMTEAAMYPNRTMNKVMLSRVPEQYKIDSPVLTGRLSGILDYVAEMTDVYALDLYRKITGQSLPSI